MTDIHHALERARRLVDAGDQDAAVELLRLARKVGDAEAACLAARRLGDFDTMAEHLDATLEAGPPERLERVCRAFGLALAAPALASLRDDLDALLEAANGRARQRRLVRAQLLAIAARASTTPAGFAWSHAGENRGGTTSYGLAVAPDPRATTLVLTAARGGAKQPSPGRALAALQPWGYDLEKNLERARAWARSPRRDDAVLRLELGAPPATAALPTGPARDPARAALAPLLEAQPSRAGFETLLRHAESDDPALAAWIEGQLEAHWPDTERCIGRRGLARAAGRPSAAWVRHLDLGSSTAPLRPEERAALLQRPLAAAIRRVTFSGDDPARLVEVLRLDGLEEVRELILDRLALDVASAPALLETPCWPRLERLELVITMRNASLGQVAELLEAGLDAAPRLRALRVYMPGKQLAARLVAKLNACATVDDLELGMLQARADLVEPLLDGALAPRLRRLALPGCELGDKDALRLAHAARLSALERLELPGNQFGGRTAVALVRSAALGALRHLDLRDAARDPEELAALVDAPELARYETLLLRTRRRPAGLVELLRDAPWLRIDPELVAGVRAS